MKIKERLISLLISRVLQKNEKFKNLHKGQTCYIIGNGASLKNMDLSAFSNHITIGVNNLYLHNDFNKLDIRYHALIEPFFMFPYFKNPYTKNIQKHIFGTLFKKVFLQYPQVSVFLSASNILWPSLNNSYFLYNFSNHDSNLKHCNISSSFSFMKGGLYAGVGLAINMGFKKAILVGCDYVFTPSFEGHFYALGPGKNGNRKENIYEKLFNEVEDVIELEVITDKGVSKWLPSQTYNEFTGNSLIYSENNEIIKKEYLAALRTAVDLKQYSRRI